MENLQDPKLFRKYQIARTTRVSTPVTQQNGRSHAVTSASPASLARKATVEKRVAVNVPGRKIIVRIVIECIDELSSDIRYDMVRLVELSCCVTMLNTSMGIVSYYDRQIALSGAAHKVHCSLLPRFI